MRLTRYLNVSNECFDRETLTIMENLEVVTLHFEADFENRRHTLGTPGNLLALREGRRPVNYRHLRLGPPSATKKTISFEYPDDPKAVFDMVYLGLVYELRVVRLAKEDIKFQNVNTLSDAGAQLGIEQKIIGRALYMKCLVGEKGVLYFQIVLPEHDILKRSAKDFEMDEIIMKFCTDNFEQI